MPHSPQNSMAVLWVAMDQDLCVDGEIWRAASEAAIEREVRGVHRRFLERAPGVAYGSLSVPPSCAQVGGLHHRYERMAA